jgi:hypothetical protein
VKGFVTTATVKEPFSIQYSATTGAAPVPVPPPIPAVCREGETVKNNENYQFNQFTTIYTCDKDHMRIANSLQDFIPTLSGGSTTNFRVGSAA